MSKYGGFLLGTVYLILVCVVVFRIAVHPTHYTTPDSIAYMNQADEIKTVFGEGNFFSEPGSIKNDFAIWPIGYPITIAFVSWITDTSSLIASKIVNFIFLGLIFLLLHRWFGWKAWFVTLLFFSYGSLEVISETWSETPFVFFVFLLCHIVSRDEEYSVFFLIVGVSMSLVLLFLFRYAGIIYFVILAPLAIRYFLVGKRKLALSYITALLISLLVVVWYFYDNKQSTGYYTGLERVVIGSQSSSVFFSQLTEGLVNELFFARKYFFAGEPPDFLFIALSILQAAALVLLLKIRGYLRLPIILKRETGVLFILSFGYLAGIILMRVFVPFDDFDFRLFFPFTVPFFVGLLSILTDDSQVAYFRKAYWIVVVFMMISLIANLPKRYILETFKNTISINS